MVTDLREGGFSHPNLSETAPKRLDMAAREQESQAAAKRAERFGRSRISRATAQAKKLVKVQDFGYNKNESGTQQSELGRFKTKLQSDSRMDKNYYFIVKNKFSHGSESAKRAFNKFVPQEAVT